MVDEVYPWWVTSDPEHPVNADQPASEAPLMSEREVEPAPEPEPPDPGPDPQQVAAEALARMQEKEAVPADLIPMQFQAKRGV